jgi:pyruvate kinase
VRAVKRLIGKGRHVPPLIAKLEKPQAIEHLDEILDVADGVMVARGDLGVEMPPEVVPVMQKEIIRRAAERRKPVITATQMLESMIDNPRPTRAEASDVANAIFDGTDAVMLSAETAAGKYPVAAVEFMARIIVEAEGHMPPPLRRRQGSRRLSISETVCESVAHAAGELDMSAIAVFTETGTTARLISKYRAPAPIYAFTRDARVANWLNTCWGVFPIHSERAGSAEAMLAIAVRDLLKLKAIKPGDVLGVVAGTTMNSPGSTNLMHLHLVESPVAVLPQHATTRAGDRRGRPNKTGRRRGKG